MTKREFRLFLLVMVTEGTTDPPLLLFQKQADGRWRGPETDLWPGETLEEAIDRRIQEAIGIKLGNRIIKLQTIYDKCPTVELRYMVLTTNDELKEHLNPNPQNGWTFLRVEGSLVDVKDFVGNWGYMVNEIIEHYQKY